MARPTPIRVRLNRPELAEQLTSALTKGDCLCTRVDDGSLLVLHRDAADDAEARVELAFFLRAWEARRANVRAELL